MYRSQKFFINFWDERISNEKLRGLKGVTCTKKKMLPTERYLIKFLCSNIFKSQPKNPI